MAAHLTEEEQIEAVKRWWKENGKVMVAVILAGIIGWFAWSNWQDRQGQIAEQTSMQYAELMAVLDGTQDANLTDKEKATARTIAEEIVASHGDSLYGNFAALHMAKLALDSGDPAEAESQLRAVINQAANSGIAKLANLRLARVLSSGGDHEGALALLNGEVAGAYSAAYAEARGDIYVAQNQLDLAQTAYEEALASLTQQEAGRSGLVQLKLNNTRTVGDQENQDAPNQPAAPSTEGEA